MLHCCIWLLCFLDIFSSKCYDMERERQVEGEKKIQIPQREHGEGLQTPPQCHMMKVSRDVGLSQIFNPGYLKT